MIPLMKNTFLNESKTKADLAEFILNSKKLSMDVNCDLFEKNFSIYQNRSYSILFNSGGSANLALLQALKNLGRIKSNARIGFSALTWSTNVMPIIQLGFEPVPIDVDPSTLNVMSYNLKDTLRMERIDALFTTNVLGFAGDLDEIRNLCDSNDILFIEDNCESLGTKLGAKLTGNFGLASTFSFFVAHHMSTIEGGMVCTDDEELMVMLKIVRANGWDRNLSPDKQYLLRKKYEISNEFYAKYSFYDLGFNLRPTEITGFLGLQQLQYLDENISNREKNYKYIEDYVEKNDELIKVRTSHIQKVSNFSIPIICKNEDLMKKYFFQFSGAGIEIRPMIAGNIQRQPFFMKYVKQVRSLPGADFLHNCSFYCGNYPDMTQAELEVISSCLLQY